MRAEVALSAVSQQVAHALGDVMCAASEGDVVFPLGDDFVGFVAGTVAHEGDQIFLPIARVRSKSLEDLRGDVCAIQVPLRQSTFALPVGLLQSPPAALSYRLQGVVLSPQDLDHFVRLIRTVVVPFFIRHASLQGVIRIAEGQELEGVPLQMNRPETLPLAYFLVGRRTDAHQFVSDYLERGAEHPPSEGFRRSYEAFAKSFMRLLSHPN